MRQEMMKGCCDLDGKPNFRKMNEFMVEHDRTSRYDAAGWALFFIWIGIAWLGNVGLGLGLLGVALITLGMQAIRKVTGVRVEGFWIFVGLGFALAAIWQLAELQVSLAPFVLIAAGLALLVWRVLPSKKATD